MKAGQAYTFRAGTPPVTTANVGIYNAVCIATKYPHRTPTPDELRRDFGMCRATAYRWVAAFKWARGQAA